MATGIRGVLDAQKLTVDTTRRLILIRDSVTKVRLARKAAGGFAAPARASDHRRGDPDRRTISSTLNYGLSLPTSFAISSFVNRPNLTNAFNFFSSSFSTFLAFGGGASLLGLGITSAQLFATVSNSNSESIFHAQVVAVDGLPASLHVGEKYPIITHGYFGNTSRQRNGLHPAAHR